ncbi:MAG: DUF2975 domain-containing protein [Saccharofermentanales bacterium]
MKITGKYSVAFFLKFGVDFILLVNVLVILALPFILNYLYDNPAIVYKDSYTAESNTRSETFDERAGSIASPESIGWNLSNEIPKESYLFMLCFLYFSGISTALILFLLRRILKNLEKDIILDYSNARAFKLLSISCFVLVLAFIIKIFIYNSFLTIFCFFVFIILGLFSLVLSEVFRQGAIIKEENALTI